MIQVNSQQIQIYSVLETIYHQTFNDLWTIFYQVPINYRLYLPMDPVWEGTANPPNYSKIYPSPTSFQKVQLDP